MRWSASYYPLFFVEKGSVMTHEDAVELFKKRGIGVVGVLTYEKSFPYCVPDVSFEQFQLLKGQIKQGLRRITLLNKEGSMLAIPLELVSKIVLFDNEVDMPYISLWEANTWAP
jgi:hypothetical protein